MNFFQGSYPYTPQQNGIAARKNSHMLDVIQTLLLESSTLSKFYIEIPSMIA